MKSPLREIPGVGERIAGVMEALGIRQVSDLRGREVRCNRCFPDAAP